MLEGRTIEIADVGTPEGPSLQVLGAVLLGTAVGKPVPGAVTVGTAVGKPVAGAEAVGIAVGTAVQ
jgi:hypothetical protein